MPIISVKNPDLLINKVIEKLITVLNNLKLNEISEEQLMEIKLISEEFEEKISFDTNKTLPEHLDELTELSDVLETVSNLNHVLEVLLPGRIKYTVAILEEIRTKNNNEILKFVSE